MEATIISSISAILISMFTYVQFSRSENRQKLEFQKLQSRDLTNRLLDLRIDNYPKAFEITEKVSQILPTHEYSEFRKNLISSLEKWRSGKIRMIISNNSNKCYHNLLSELRKGPSKNNTYSHSQLETTWLLTKKFRRSLREDIGIMHKEDENKK